MCDVNVVAVDREYVVVDEHDVCNGVCGTCTGVMCTDEYVSIYTQAWVCGYEYRCPECRYIYFEEFCVTGHVEVSCMCV